MTRGRRLIPPKNTTLHPIRLWAAGLALLGVIGAVLTLNAADDGVPEVFAHRAALPSQNSLIAEVQVTLSETARVFIEYENPEAGKFVTALSEPGTEHTIPVVRLRPETAYAYTIGIQAGHGGRAYGPSGEFATGPLPPELAGMQIRTDGRSSRPLIVTDYNDGHNAWYFFWDETGNIVWYYKVEHPEKPENLWRVNPIKQKPDGNLVFISNLCCIIEISPLGEMVYGLLAEADGAAGKPHHDFLLMDDGRILFLSYEIAAIGASAPGRSADDLVGIDRLLVLNPANGTIGEVWDARDSWDITDPAQWVSTDDFKRNWAHMNSLGFGVDGRLIVSARNRNQIVAFSPDLHTIEWQLGGPDSDYAFPNPADRFYGQHTAAQLPNGHILLFDNGDGRPDSEGGAYSRALELRLDEANGTAVKVWEYRHRPDIYSRVISSAFRLGNGHTLVNFGIASDAEKIFLPLTFVEVDRSGHEVFRVETFSYYAGGGGFPRRVRAADGITSIMGETMLRPPAAGPPGGPPYPDWPRQELAAQSAAAQEPFDLRIDGRRLVYRQAPCVPKETGFAFLLHLYPANPADLPEERREHGFENRDFRFGQWGAIRDGECQASVPLPDYPITQIRTGQYIPGGERLWEVELPGPEAAAPPPPAP